MKIYFIIYFLYLYKKPHIFECCYIWSMSSRKWFNPQTEIDHKIFSYFIKETVCISQTAWIWIFVHHLLAR